MYLLKQKSETFEKFKFGKNLMESQTGKRIKILWTSNGLKFCNNEFDQFCNNTQIKRHITIPNTPRRKVRCLLVSSGDPKVLWGKTLIITSYIVNRTPSSASGDKTPKEKWIINISLENFWLCCLFPLEYRKILT